MIETTKGVLPEDSLVKTEDCKLTDTGTLTITEYRLNEELVRRDLAFEVRLEPTQSETN